MNTYPTRAGNIGALDPGTTLVSVNGVHFGDPYPEGFGSTRPGLLVGRGLTIEGGFSRVYLNGMLFASVTVWMGAAMVTLTLNTTDVVVLGTIPDPYPTPNQ